MEPAWVQQYVKQHDSESMLLPWPSFGWQQTTLLAGVPLGLGVAVAGIVALVDSGPLVWPLVNLFSTPLEAIVAGLILAGLAVHGGCTTRWLNGTLEAPFAGKVTAGVAIVVTIAAFTVFVVLPLLLIMLVLALFGGVPTFPFGGSGE